MEILKWLQNVHAYSVLVVVLFLFFNFSLFLFYTLSLCEARCDLLSRNK